MQSRKQLESFKKKSAQKPKTYKSKNSNKKFQEIVPRLVENGNIQVQGDLILGGEFAAAETLKALGFEIIDRPRNYSYCTDPQNSENKKIFKNKNIVTDELLNQENEKISASNYFADEQDSLFAPDIEKREAKNKNIKNSTNKPSVNIKIDLTDVVVTMADICMPEKNGGVEIDSDFLKI